jgi:XTP/dITP diphosphohydrolase
MVEFNPRTIVIATRNTGKLREFRVMLEPLECEILSLLDIDPDKFDMDVEETGGTFAENARLKALAYSKWTPHPVLADDSGLEVFALEGRPGIYSARYAGADASDEDRNRKLLEELGSEATNREARFFCALALAQDNEILMEAEGECRGFIAHAPRGTNGFGYDSVFLFPELDRTFAELNPEEKNSCSHRTRAIRNLIAQLKG